MDTLKQLMFIILKKYKLNPAVFSGRLSFEIEVKKGNVSIITHSMVADAETLH